MHAVNMLIYIPLSRFEAGAEYPLDFKVPFREPEYGVDYMWKAHAESTKSRYVEQYVYHKTLRIFARFHPTGEYAQSNRGPQPPQQHIVGRPPTLTPESWQAGYIDNEPVNLAAARGLGS